MIHVSFALIFCFQFILELRVCAMNILLVRAYDKIKKDAGRSKQFVQLKEKCDAAREALEQHQKNTGSAPVRLHFDPRLVAADC